MVMVPWSPLWRADARAGQGIAGAARFTALPRRRRERKIWVAKTIADLGLRQGNDGAFAHGSLFAMDDHFSGHVRMQRAEVIDHPNLLELMSKAVIGIKRLGF